MRAQFLEYQSAVLTKALDLEKGEQRGHVHLGKGESIPYEVKGILGSGRFSEVEKVVSLISYREFARKKFRRGRQFEATKKEVKSFLTELRVLKRIHHIHCVEMVRLLFHRHYALEVAYISQQEPIC
jgi:serine/threonine protein kinase